MEQTDDIEKQIELKRLEIEKLKLERELQANTPTTPLKQEVVAVRDTYPNRIALNIVILIVASIVFYLLPWGSLNSSYNTNFGGGGSSMSFTGFNIGLFTYSWPLTISNIILLVFIALNKLKPVGIVAIVALIISLVAVGNASDFSRLSAGYSSQFGSVSAGIKSTGWCYILPISYLILVAINIAQKQNALHRLNAESGKMQSSSLFSIEDWEKDYQLSKINLYLTIISLPLSLLLCWYFAMSYSNIVYLVMFLFLLVNFAVYLVLHKRQRNVIGYPVNENQIKDYRTLIICGLAFNIFLFSVYSIVIMYATIHMYHVGLWQMLSSLLLIINWLICSFNMVATYKRYNNLNFTHVNA